MNVVSVCVFHTVWTELPRRQAGPTSFCVSDWIIALLALYLAPIESIACLLHEVQTELFGEIKAFSRMNKGWKAHKEEGRRNERKAERERAGTCTLKCLIYNANCGTFHPVTMASTKTRNCFSLGHQGGEAVCKEKCVGMRASVEPLKEEKKRSEGSIKENVQSVR